VRHGTYYEDRAGGHDMSVAWSKFAKGKDMDIHNCQYRRRRRAEKMLAAPWCCKKIWIAQ